MKTSRCGLTDIAASFNLKETFWRKDPILWDFRGATNKQIKLATVAFQLWGKYANINFQQSFENPNIIISFKYKDPLQPPLEIHINQNKDWNEELYDISKDKLSLFIALVHEIGHAIGIDHSPIHQSLMHSVYHEPTSPLNAEDFELSEDDQLAVASLSTQYVSSGKRIQIHFYKKYVWIVKLKDNRYGEPKIIFYWLNFLPSDLERIDAIYQRPSGEIVFFINQEIYMMSYPGFKLLDGFPRKQDTIGVTSKLKINTALNSYTGCTYIFYEQNFFVELDECSFYSRRYGNIYNEFDAFPSSYLNQLNPYIGATVGRVANRVGNAKIMIDEMPYDVSSNLSPHQLHGGFRGFDKVNWEYYVDSTRVIMSYDSPDLEEGYPGNVLINIMFELNLKNEFLIKFKATTTKPTFVNLTNHSYFNLAGHGSGATEIYKHVVSINANETTEVDKDSIPTGKLLKVSNTPLDLQIPKVLGTVIHTIPDYDGYDHNFCINKGSDQDIAFVARAMHPSSGRVLEIYSNQPGVQFYTANEIPEDPKIYKGDVRKLNRLEGKDGYCYYKHGSMCFETQNWPDAVNHKNFPKAILYPGDTYKHTCIYKFWIQP
ncbi:hypothetical protein FQA39_LY14926 [Lamprigera yunnana]|nr:hypothetical protein FQA39_LY14926 [Lamprigera yunnana]